MRHRLDVKRHLRWTGLSAASGVMAGTAAAVFLHLLDWATRYRESQPALVWGLPLAGLCIGWTYHAHGRDVAPGNNLILDEIHDPKKTLPLRMAPLVLAGTIFTHLFGGSAGREGTAVQMGASLSDQLSRWFRVERDERKILLVCGAGAGFGAAIGAPWAGVIFGMEVLQVGKLRLFAWFESLVASFVAFATATLLRSPHSVFPRFETPSFEARTLFFVALAGAVFGLAAQLFARITHGLERLQARYIRYPPFKPFLAGFALIALYALIGSHRYAGLGIPVIQEALRRPAGFADPAWKALLTALTVGSGFKGGEFVPLVFIGATLGSALSILLPVPFQLLATVGFAAVFAGAANTPIACSIMAMELFGPGIAPYAFVACFMSYLVAGSTGIYGAQRIHGPKHETLVSLLAWLGGLPKRFKCPTR